jgi:pilus assembly protein FimV
MKGPIKSALSVALMMAAGQVFAFGLGTIRIKSGLNQPLLAEIPVVIDSAAEAEGLRVDLASAEDFQRVGLSRERVTVAIQFTVADDGHGQKLIRLTTKEAVREPFLDFLIEANWSHGKLLREYTVLLDPPVTAPAVATGGSAAKPAEKPKPAQIEPQAPASQRREETAKPAAAAVPVSRAGEYTVQRGDTLWRIANENIDDPRDSNRMLLALFKANPGAFSGNINKLMAGAVLRIPSSDDVRAVGSLREAAEAVRAQNQVWREGGVATLVANTGSVSAEEEKSAPAAAAKTAQPEHLALVPPSGVGSESSSSRGGSGGGGKESAALRADLARTKEALSSREAETGELKSRVSQLEEINSKSQRLISLKDSEIAELQNKLKQLEATKAEATKAEAAKSAKTAEATQAKPATPAEAKPASAPAANASASAPSTPEKSAKTAEAAQAKPATPAEAKPASTPAAADASASAPAAGTPVVHKVAKPAAKPAPVAADKPWYADYWDGSLYTLYGMGGVLALIVIVLLARAFGRKKVNPRLRPAVAAVAQADIGEDVHDAAAESDAERHDDGAQPPSIPQPPDAGQHEDISLLEDVPNAQEKAASVPHASEHEPVRENEALLPEPLGAEQPETVETEDEAVENHAGLPDEDVIGTRLDLARAYLDMGDAEGARSMLDEVLAEGNQAQKEEASKLLGELG